MLTLLAFTACGPSVNNPAVETAIKDLNTAYTEAYNSGDLEWLSENYYTDDAVMLPANDLLLNGKEAVLARDQGLIDQYSDIQFDSSIEEVQSSGDLAVARGGFIWSASPRASGLSDVRMEGKWISTFNRQDDDSWKCSQLIWNSDQPSAGATADGAEEEALLQIQRDWTNALVNKDRAVLDSLMAKEYVSIGAEGVRNKRQAIAEIMSSALKIESAELINMQPMVFGDIAVVHGSSMGKGTERGKPFEGKYVWTDIFEKRDGSWQCVASYGSEAE
jgi:ketosteroid isomerase-like protein